jgi:hypothetical protein
MSRNPDWTRDETILLMELYLSAPRAGRSHPEVLALSALLRAAAHRAGLHVHHTLRNPSGIAMRLRNFGRYDPGAAVDKDAGLKPGGAVDALVWQEFGNNPEALAAEVARVRRMFSRDAREAGALSSRGPQPSFGERTSLLEDGSAGVYLLLIDGPIDVLAPSVDKRSGFATAKIGRTADLARRLDELSAGLPPDSAIVYVPVALRMFSSAGEAHAFEREMLDTCDSHGWSLGGEFVYAPLCHLKAAMSSRRRPLRTAGARP